MRMFPEEFDGYGITKGVLLKNLTRMGVGGRARYFFRAKSEASLAAALSEAVRPRILRASARLEFGSTFGVRHGIPWIIVGEGSNIIPSDTGYSGLVIKNEIKRLEIKNRIVYAGAGNNLLAFIRVLNQKGLAGYESMAGIPGTLGGALYGCAGAYGTEIKDHCARVKILEVSEKTVRARWVSKKECRFEYRGSVFKDRKHWVILGAEFRLKNGDPRVLKKNSRDIMKLRDQKYPRNLQCPGSFFKNIILETLTPGERKSLLAAVDPGAVKHGKLPAGYLLERVGARGMKQGDICVASYHGNLIYNAGKGTARDIERLARMLKGRVYKKFGIALEEEIQYI